MEIKQKYWVVAFTPVEQAKAKEMIDAGYAPDDFPAIVKKALEAQYKAFQATFDSGNDNVAMQEKVV